MKSMKCALYMGLGAGLALAYKAYEKEITCMCKKMMKKECKLIEDGLEID